MYRNIDTSGILGRWSVLVIDVAMVLHELLQSRAQCPSSRSPMRLHVAGSDKLFVTLMLNVSLALVCLPRSVMFTGVGGVSEILTRNYAELIDNPVSISARGPAPSAVVRPHSGNDV